MPHLPRLLSATTILAALPLISSCATVPVAVRLPAVEVAAGAETVPVGTLAVDAADDPAIWRNADNPAQSLIVGTDKRAGLYVYDLSGAVRSFTAAGEINNVDLRDGVSWRGRRIVLVGASNRNSINQPAFNLYALDPASGGLSLLASLPVAATGEAYGFCFGRVRGETMPHAYVVVKDGRIFELAINDGGEGHTPTAGVVRSFGVASQAEGCVVDDRTGQLYLGEEDVAIWRFDLRAEQPEQIEFARIGSTYGLVADVEGLAIAPSGTGGGYLVASSQGDNAYAVLDLDSGKLKGRFRVGAGGEPTSDTDGIELILGDFGPRFRHGLLVVQDGDNAPDAQNFKLVDWQLVEAALGL